MLWESLVVESSTMLLLDLLKSKERVLVLMHHVMLQQF